MECTMDIDVFISQIYADFYQELAASKPRKKKALVTVISWLCNPQNTNTNATVHLNASNYRAGSILKFSR